MFLGENVVHHGKQDGTSVALENACLHRKLPLSNSAFKGNTVECGYHGFTFNSTGSCVAVPTQRDAIPKRAVVRSYPVVDLYRFVWIWMGDPSSADPDQIFNIETFDDPTWGKTKGGVLEIVCRYLRVCDNLLDPSHVARFQVTSFAGGGTNDAPSRVEKTGDGIEVTHRIFGQQPSPYHEKLLAFQGPCDRLQHYGMCRPAMALNKSICTPPGTAAATR